MGRGTKGRKDLWDGPMRAERKTLARSGAVHEAVRERIEATRLEAEADDIN